MEKSEDTGTDQIWRSPAQQRPMWIHTLVKPTTRYDDGDFMPSTAVIKKRPHCEHQSIYSASPSEVLTTSKHVISSYAKLVGPATLQCPPSRRSMTSGMRGAPSFARSLNMEPKMEYTLGSVWVASTDSRRVHGMGVRMSEVMSSSQKTG